MGAVEPSSIFKRLVLRNCAQGFGFAIFCAWAIASLGQVDSPLAGVAPCEDLIAQRKIILILGTENDLRDPHQHSIHILKRLQSLGYSATLLDTSWFPNRLQISFDPIAEDWLFVLPTGQEIKSSQIYSVYWRLNSGIRTHDRAISQNDSRAFIDSFLLHLPARWVNGKEGLDLHQTKPVQLALVKNLGVLIPQTLVTNDPQKALAFIEREGDVIVKPVQGGFETRTISDRILSQIRNGALTLSPITLQQNVRGLDIRIFSFGDEILAIEIESQTTDFRSDPRAKFRPHHLPDEVKRQVKAIRRTLKLEFSGMDFKLTPDGRYIFLEANPSPMFIGFEKVSGIPLTDHLIKLLIEPNFLVTD